ncbi:MAG: cysteine desulfurase [Alphaproteobacteria bacterium]
MTFKAEKIREDFPCLQQEIKGKPFVFLDSAASAQKPQIVIDTHRKIYEKEYANIHRGAYTLSNNLTTRFEETREKVAKFIGARTDKEIVFVRGATEAINLVAHSYGRTFFKKGDEVIISELEHHANIVPWQILRDEIGIVLRIIPINERGELDLVEYKKILNEKTAFVSITHVSNALGTINPIKSIIDQAHEVGAKVLIDGCQAAPHLPINVQNLDCDFYVFSGHKIYGPSGVGVLYGKEDLLNSMPPYQTGGEMIQSVSFEKATFQKAPLRFEAGTPAIAEVIAMGTAIDYLSIIDRVAAIKHERDLLRYLMLIMHEVPHIKMQGLSSFKIGVLSFTHDNAHPSDIGMIMDQEGIAIRTGHHCAEPLMGVLGVPATARVSLGIYSTRKDIDAFLKALHKVNKLFG